MNRQPKAAITIFLHLVFFVPFMFPWILNLEHPSVFFPFPVPFLMVPTIGVVFLLLLTSWLPPLYLIFRISRLFYSYVFVSILAIFENSELRIVRLWPLQAQEPMTSNLPLYTVNRPVRLAPRNHERLN